MSQENVELILGAHLGSDVDVAQLLRDDEGLAAWVEVIVPLFHPDCEFVTSGVPDVKTYVALYDFMASYLDWMAPWATYRTEVEDAIDRRACPRARPLFRTPPGKHHGGQVLSWQRLYRPRQEDCPMGDLRGSRRSPQSRGLGGMRLSSLPLSRLTARPKHRLRGALLPNSRDLR
jgi:hypothetical protein